MQCDSESYTNTFQVSVEYHNRELKFDNFEKHRKTNNNNAVYFMFNPVGNSTPHLT